MTKSWHETCFSPILLFDPGGAILPPRPQFDCAIVSSGGQGWPRFSRPPEGLVLDGREHDGTLAVSERKTTMRGSGARLVATAIVAASRFPFPQSLQKSGNSNREAHQLSRFREHQTVCSCLLGTCSACTGLRSTAGSTAPCRCRSWS